METTDKLGRRRGPEQNRGLRPLFPRLPGGVESRVVRIAMTHPAWARLDSMLAEQVGATRPRAFGESLERMLAQSDVAAAMPWSQPSQTREIPKRLETVADWQAWQIRKERALLSVSQTN